MDGNGERYTAAAPTIGAPLLVVEDTGGSVTHPNEEEEQIVGLELSSGLPVGFDPSKGVPSLFLGGEDMMRERFDREYRVRSHREDGPRLFQMKEREKDGTSTPEWRERI